MIFPKEFMTGKLFRGLQFDTSPPEAPSPQTYIQNTPSATETSAQAIQAQIDALPKILDAQKQYGSQFTQQNLDSVKKFGPEYAEAAIDLQNKYGTKYAQATKDQQNVLNPETLVAENAIKKYLENGPESLTAEEEANFRNDVRSAQSTRGLAESGFGAQEEFAKLTGLRQQLKTQYLNTALSTAGRVPVTGGQNVQASPAASANQLVQNVGTGDFFGGQNSLNNFNSNIYGSQVSAYNAGLGYKSSIYGANMGLASSVIGAAGSIGAAAATPAAIVASSAVLKKDVKEIESALGTVEKMSGVRFNWIYKDQPDGGVIAEELEKALPDAVVVVDGVKHIKPMLVIGYLIEAVKELSDEVKNLKSQVLA